MAAARMRGPGGLHAWRPMGEGCGMNPEDTVVVSGAGTGIGRAAARRLALGGFHITAVGRRREPLEQLAGQLGGCVEVIAADVATEAGAMAVAAGVCSAGRRCAGVVAAAGGISPAPAGDDLQAVRRDWQSCFESNVLTAVLLVEALRERIERDGSRVVLLSSVAALRGSGGGAYGAMKAALHAWVYDLARQLGPRGGTANAVAPGFVPDTEFWAGRLTAESRRERAAQALVGREGTPEEVASLIAWLLGPDSGWMTGQVLSPNGGVVLGR
jgi:3-oxoacyl-[acyl-carrier protein] reductase